MITYGRWGGPDSGQPFLSKLIDLTPHLIMETGGTVATVNKE